MSVKNGYHCDCKQISEEKNIFKKSNTDRYNLVLWSIKTRQSQLYIKKLDTHVFKSEPIYFNPSAKQDPLKAAAQTGFPIQILPWGTPRLDTGQPCMEPPQHCIVRWWSQVGGCQCISLTQYMVLYACLSVPVSFLGGFSDTTNIYHCWWVSYSVQ